MCAYLLRLLMKSSPALCLTVLCLMVGDPAPLYAHSGATLAAPTTISSSITIDGTITEAVWGAGVPAAQVPNTCAEFSGMSGPPLTVYALNDGINLFLAFDMPDSTANTNDLFFLFFDANHSDGASPVAGDQAVQLGFDNLSANNIVPTGQHYDGTGTGWSGAIAGLPAGVQAKYRRDTTGTGKWQLEMQLPLTGPVVGLAFVYLNATGGAAGDCNDDGILDDFYAPFPATLPVPSFVSAGSLPAAIANPGVWGDLNFGPQPPTVSFQAPLCCHSTDIAFTPSTQPFNPTTGVDILARVHNLHATSDAQNVNVEIRVHNFGTGGTVISPFPLQTTVPSILHASSSFSNSVNWPPPLPGGLHGCIRAEIKPPTSSPYFIASGNAIAQHNIDVAMLLRGQRKAFKFVTFNPEQEGELKILLAKQELLPPGLDGLRFVLQQPDRPLRPQEEVPVQLMVSASSNVPVTKVPKQSVRVPPTAGGTAVPPLRKRSGTAPISIAVKPAQRLYLTATGTVDLDGSGRLPSVGPDGKDFSDQLGKWRFLLSGESASRFAGALIGSFDAFKSSFVVGSETTLTVPNGISKLWLAVNDVDRGYANNTGKGYAVELATLPALQALRAPASAAPTAYTAKAAPVVLPQVNVTATSAARVTVDRRVYNLLTNHGGVTYQFLVTEQDGQGKSR